MAAKKKVPPAFLARKAPPKKAAKKAVPAKKRGAPPLVRDLDRDGM